MTECTDVLEEKIVDIPDINLTRQEYVTPEENKRSFAEDGEYKCNRTELDPKSIESLRKCENRVVEPVEYVNLTDAICRRVTEVICPTFVYDELQEYKICQRIFFTDNMFLNPPKQQCFATFSHEPKVDCANEVISDLACQTDVTQVVKSERVCYAGCFIKSPEILLDIPVVRRVASTCDQGKGPEDTTVHCR